MRFFVSCLLVVVLVAAHTPMARAQSEIQAPIGNRPVTSSSGILASAERMASMAEAEQDEMFVQRRRSGALAGLGAVLAGVGVVLALRPPSECMLMGSSTDRTRSDLGFTTVVWDYRYEGVVNSGRCDVRVLQTTTWGGGLVFRSVEYRSDASILGRDAHDFEGRTAYSSKAMKYTGLAMAGAGGALLWFGLRRVEVPFRVDMTAARGLRVRASRSFGW